YGVETLASAAACSAWAPTTEALPGCGSFLRIQTTSNAVHAAVPASTSSIGRGPRFRPPASGAPSTTSAWPLSVSATKVTPSVHLIRVFTPPPCTQSQHLLTDFETSNRQSKRLTQRRR